MSDKPPRKKPGPKEENLYTDEIIDPLPPCLEDLFNGKEPYAEVFRPCRQALVFGLGIPK